MGRNYCDMKNSLFLALPLCTLLLADVRGAEQNAFLKTHCIRCHGSETQKSDRRFDTLSETISSASDLDHYQDIVDQLNLQSMPPEDEPQPTDAERAAVVKTLTSRIAAAQAQLTSGHGHSVLRRLNAWEYRHTIGDLLGLNVEAWNPAEDFPAEVKVKGFDNNGSQLVTSGMLLEQYFAVSEQAIHRATAFGERPDTKTYSQRSPYYFSGNDYDDLPKLFQTDRFRFTPETPYTDLYGRHYRGGHIGFLPLARGGLPDSGNYTIRVLAAAVDRTHDYGEALGDFRNGDPLVLELASVDRRGSVKSTGNVSQMISLKRIELTSEKPQWIEWTGYLEAGYEPEVRFRNGPLAAKRMIRLLTTKGGDHEEFKPFVNLDAGEEKAHGVLKAYRGPKLRVWEIQIEGPHLESWPPRGHERLYGDLQIEDLNRETIAQRLHAFAEIAFRRPVASELDPIQSLVSAKLDSGVEPLDALQLGFQAILCAPGFLYLDEGQGPLDDFALASRLSYFLWSSMPDERLQDLAAKGKLRDGATLRAQIDRMLADPKSHRFVRHFIRRWLDLDNIGEMPPSSDFLEYYRDNLDSAMRSETESFFRHILDANLPPREFLTADYSFLNRELAAHYGIDAVEGSALRRVSLQGTTRSGLLGHALFLTASANGVDTSPVVRGIYVLEKLLGYTPPPPPPNVPEIEPDIRGAKTIREQLAKHRSVATCAECHRKIDPLGFALENFDAIGGWRDEYGKNLPIDSSGKLPGGETFDTVPEFREQIIRREDQFVRCLTEKLLTYAIGRELEVGDRPAIDSILQDVQRRDRGLRDLVTLVIVSETFRNN
jgi:hypothetical protein